MIVRNMRQHSQNAEVQQQGCNCLYNLAYVPDNKVKIREEGGIEVILEALRQHSGHAMVQQHGCNALGSLAFSNADNKVKIGEEGGIEVIVEALRQHSGHAGVQEQGCLALACLANEGNIAAAGGIEAILQAMRQHPTHANVQEYGCWSLGNIGWSDPQLQKQIKQAGAEATVQAAMAAPNATADTKNWGGELLEKLKKV